MQSVAGEGVTILSAKKKLISIAEDELLMFLKACEANPCSWTNIIVEMMVNVTGLHQDLQELYRRYTVKQLKLRLSTKLGKLIATPLEKIADDEIRNQIKKIKEMDLRLTVPKTPAVNKNVDVRETAAVINNVPPQNAPVGDNSENEQQPTSSNVDTHRKKLADGMSSNESEKSSTSPLPKKKRKRAKRTTLDFARENQLLYNKFIRKAMPKVLKMN